MPKPKKRIIIVGGNAAGLAAASRAKKTNPDIDVLVIEKSPHVSYASCGIPYMISGIVNKNEMFALSLSELQNKRGIEVWVEHEAKVIDPVKRTISVVSNATGREHILNYDKLILSTGATPIRPNFVGVDSENVYSIRTLSDGLNLLQDIQQHRPQKVVVVGAGFLGLEMVEAFRIIGLNVVLIEKANQVLPGLESQIANKIVEELVAHNVEMHFNSTIEGAERIGNKVQRISVGVTNEPIPCDLVVLCLGVRPNVSLAKDCGIPLGSSGAIIVNELQQTRRMNVFAAGDCSETNHLVTKKPTWMPLAPPALKQGRVAGTNAAGGSMRFPGIVGTQLLKCFDQQVAITGLTITQANNAGLDPEATVITQDSRAKYYPGNEPIITAVIYERGSNRLLGAQMLGIEGAAHRINVFATALHAGMNLQEMRNLDLGYAPPFAAIWDPILAACSTALKK